MSSHYIQPLGGSHRSIIQVVVFYGLILLGVHFQLFCSTDMLITALEENWIRKLQVSVTI